MRITKIKAREKASIGKLVDEIVLGVFVIENRDEEVLAELLSVDK